MTTGAWLFSMVASTTTTGSESLGLNVIVFSQEENINPNAMVINAIRLIIVTSTAIK
jgi:hypothetical protein